jgi:hypothetical protein
MRPIATDRFHAKRFGTIASLSAIICIFIATSGVSGCSFLFTEGPKNERVRDTRGATGCTTSYVAPVVDLVLTGLYVAGTIYGATRSDAEVEKQGTSREATVGGGVLMTGLLATSAGVGFSRVGDCREALEPATSRYLSRRPPPTMQWTPSGVKPVD